MPTSAITIMVSLNRNVDSKFYFIALHILITVATLGNYLIVICFVLDKLSIFLYYMVFLIRRLWSFVMCSFVSFD